MQASVRAEAPGVINNGQEKQGLLKLGRAGKMSPLVASR